MGLAFKLDENLSPGLKDVLVSAGYDACTVIDQGLQGVTDEALAEVCRRERRCIVTADEGFAQRLRFPPEEFAGIVVLRHPRPNLRAMESLLRQVLPLFLKETPEGRLWIVEPGRVRVHEPAK